jgi:hypothetical protein
MTLKSSDAFHRGIGRTKAELASKPSSHAGCLIKRALFANPQKVLPLAKFALKSHALRNLECRNDAPLDLLAGLPGTFAGSTISD